MEKLAVGEGRFDTNLPPDLVIKGQEVELKLLDFSHVEGLIEAASSGQLWELDYTGVPCPEKMKFMVEDALDRHQNGKEFPFVVLCAGEVVGTTRYYNLNPTNRNLSIGYTWYAAKVHRTIVNTECKYLLLKHAFEKINCISVQWHTDHRNKRSQEAIKRLGAKFEGVLRNDKIVKGGIIRHTHCFSMLEDEWPLSKSYLESRMALYVQAK
ncbi:MAG: GNAT family N-acetyltransferase [Gammaproteobacteria bacterium]|nr:GNAT family N-acetyltransferase [Gammaproteobacteria bacterium]